MRHGKPHHDDKPAAAESSTRQRERDRAQQQHAARAEQQQPQKASNKHEVVNSQAQRDAEAKVLEEKESKSKLPVYKGLERFKLLEKMGEYVPCLLAVQIRLNRSLQRCLLQCLQGR